MNEYKFGICHDDDLVRVHVVSSLEKDNYRKLRKGELMLATDLIWRHPGQWEEFGNNEDTNYPWSESYRTVIRKVSDLKFIFGVPREGEDSDEVFYEFCRKTNLELPLMIDLFIKSRRESAFVSLNALIFNYIDDSDIGIVGVRLNEKDIPLTNFPFVTKKLSALGIGEILADTNWHAEQKEVKPKYIKTGFPDLDN